MDYPPTPSENESDPTLGASTVLQILVQELDARSLILEEILKNEGELTPQLERAIHGNAESLQSWSDSLFSALEALEYEIEFRKSRIRTASAKVRRLTEINERARSTLKQRLSSEEGCTLKGSESRALVSPNGFEISLKDGESLEQVPAIYVRKKVLLELDKARLQKDIKVLGLTTVHQIKKMFPFLEATPSYRLSFHDVKPDRKEIK